MIPEKNLNVLDKHLGFTALTGTMQYVKVKDTSYNGFHWHKQMVYDQTLWRPGCILKGQTIGTLVSYDEKSFYQLNDDVTVAYYKVKGYRYTVVVWFDNKTGKRIA